MPTNSANCHFFMRLNIFKGWIFITDFKGLKVGFYFSYIQVNTSFFYCVYFNSHIFTTTLAKTLFFLSLNIDFTARFRTGYDTNFLKIPSFHQSFFYPFCQKNIARVANIVLLSLKFTTLFEMAIIKCCKTIFSNRNGSFHIITKSP